MQDHNLKYRLGTPLVLIDPPKGGGGGACAARKGQRELAALGPESA